MQYKNDAFSMTFTEERIAELLKTALMMFWYAETPKELDVITFELMQLKQQIVLREREQLLRLPKILHQQYKQAMNVYKTELEQTLLDIKRKRKEFEIR
jgi:hypothetical protein